MTGYWALRADKTTDLAPGSASVRTVTSTYADRHGSSLALAYELLEDIELSHLPAPQLLLKASRLARLVRDDEAQEWLGFELSGYVFDSATNNLLTRSGRWADDEHSKAYTQPLAELSAVAVGERAKLAALQGAAFGANTALITMNNHHAMISNAASSIARMESIEGKVVGAVYIWVTRTYDELLFSDLQSDLFAQAQAEIDSRVIPLSETALDKIEAISERLRAGDPESVSHAMSTVRRLMTAAADALFPPSDDPFLLGEQELSVKANAVLNRLNAYVAQRVESQGRRERLRHTLRDIWSRASSGDHADLDVTEARYLFLQTYVVLGELLALDG